MVGVCGWGVVGPNTMLASSYVHSPNKAAHDNEWLGGGGWAQHNVSIKLLASPNKAAHNNVVGVWLGGVVGPNTMLASSFLHSPNKAARNEVCLGGVVGVWLGPTQC